MRYILIAGSLMLSSCCCHQKALPRHYEHPPCGNSISFEDLENICGYYYITQM